MHALYDVTKRATDSHREQQRYSQRAAEILTESSRDTHRALCMIIWESDKTCFT